MWCLLDDGRTKNRVVKQGSNIILVTVPQQDADKNNVRTLIDYDTDEKIIVKDCDLYKYNVLGHYNESSNGLKCYIFISKLCYKLLEYVDLEIIKNEEITDFEKSCKDYFCEDSLDYWIRDKYGLVWYARGEYYDLLHILHKFEENLNIDVTNYKKFITYSHTFRRKYIITFSPKFKVFFSKARYLSNNFGG